MTKIELINAISKEAKINKVAAAKAVDVVVDSVTSTLQKGGKFSIAGLGTFKVKSRKARIGRNPKTGESIQIPSRKVPVFQVSASLKQAVK